MEKETVAIIGCGLVGQSWAIVFSTADYNVQIYDNQTDKLVAGMAAVRSKMAALEEKQALRGHLSCENAFRKIKAVCSIRDCVENAVYIQECVFEDFDLKRSVIAEVVRHMLPNAVVGSSGGNFYPSRLSEGLDRKERILVAHPINPVHLIPLVEIITAPWTDKSAIIDTRRILSEAGQVPIVAKKETRGFILCRLQHVITAECFKLFRDDVTSAEDIDKVFPFGLGLRYAFLGPLEVPYLNANGSNHFCSLYRDSIYELLKESVLPIKQGMNHFCSLYGDSIYELQKESGPPIKLSGDPLKKIQDSLERRIPVDKIDEKRKWRDVKMVELLRLKKREIC